MNGLKRNQDNILIEAIRITSIARFSILEEGVDHILRSGPKHDADWDTRVLDRLRDDSTPKVEHNDTGRRG